MELRDQTYKEMLQSTSQYNMDFAILQIKQAVEAMQKVMVGMLDSNNKKIMALLLGRAQGEAHKSASLAGHSKAPD